MRHILPYLFIIAVGALSFWGMLEFKKYQKIEAQPLAGYDKNQNGIRDDLDSMVEHLSSVNPEVGKAYTYLIKVMQESILVADSKEKSIANFRDYQKGVDCVFSFDPEQKISGEIIKRINDQLLNNKARKKAQEVYSSHLDGLEVESTPWRERYKACSFDRSIPAYIEQKSGE